MNYVTLSPMESGEFITANANDIKVDVDKCKEAAIMIMDSLVDGSIGDIEYKSNPLHPTGLTHEEHLNWVFVLDTLNFSFWPSEGEHYDVTYKDKKETGYLACCAAFCKAFDNGVRITDANWMENVTMEELDEILKSDSGHSIPLLFDRYRALHESGAHLNQKFGGQFLNLVKKCEGKAQTMIRQIIMIESFRDFTMYKNKQVSLLKRVQILVSDTWGLLKDGELKELVAFPDLDTLTMFADYRVPQVLSYLGCLEYSEKLLEVLQTSQLLKYGDTREVELRGCSIYAVNEIYKEVCRLRKDNYNGIDFSDKRPIFAIDIDVWLWQFRREHAEDVEALVPYHRTRSIYY
ncbi:hypothetical protein PMAYCL1PPCAC_29912 [Pristionchus mayeri]|uniref:Queuosine 5'-phosphate N-glycosylase/hydrolase n=1 Tax=Pristionchus mayeri TaxID=1317129 RepID=A0AAN5DBW0_9BILA|nr:hypothetical protein PMAYCL1PPCAC_29912 [Pristionchus mayeri]